MSDDDSCNSDSEQIRDERFAEVRRQTRKIVELFIGDDDDPVEAVESGEIIKLYKGNSYRYFYAYDGKEYICRHYDRHSGKWRRTTNPNPYPIESDIRDGYSWEVVSFEDSPFERDDLATTGSEHGGDAGDE